MSRIYSLVCICHLEELDLGQNDALGQALEEVAERKAEFRCVMPEDPEPRMLAWLGASGEDEVTNIAEFLRLAELVGGFTRRHAGCEVLWFVDLVDYREAHDALSGEHGLARLDADADYDFAARFVFWDDLGPTVDQQESARAMALDRLQRAAPPAVAAAEPRPRGLFRKKEPSKPAPPSDDPAQRTRDYRWPTPGPQQRDVLAQLASQPMSPARW